MAKLKKLKETDTTGESVYIIREYPTKRITKKALTQMRNYLMREINNLQVQLDDVNNKLAEIEELEE
jgi:hypothetical protein